MPKVIIIAPVFSSRTRRAALNNSLEMIYEVIEVTSIKAGDNPPKPGTRGSLRELSETYPCFSDGSYHPYYCEQIYTDYNSGKILRR